MLRVASKWLLTAASTMILMLDASPATAQVSEQDRAARCENNRARVIELERQRVAGGMANEEEIARMRTMMTFLREMSATLVSASENYDLDGRRDIQRNYSADQLEQVRRYAEWYGQRLPPQFDDLDLRIAANATLLRLQQDIDAAVARAPERDALLRELQNHRTNLVALGCDQPRPAESNNPFASRIVGNWSWSCCSRRRYEGAFTLGPVSADGRFRGSFGGGQVGEIEGTLTGDRISFRRSWNDGVARAQQWEGTISDWAGLLVIQGNWTWVGAPPNEQSATSSVGGDWRASLRQ